MIAKNQIFIILLLIALSAARNQIWIKYQALKEQTDVFEKYFHRIKYGYFVDLGGFNPIQYSNTVKLSNWNGIIVEANQKRSENIRDFQPHITSLNYAMSNVSGEVVTFYQANYTQASSLSIDAIVGRTYKEQKAFAISMADLCHKYYKAKPNLLNIDVEGIGQMVLRANDWSTDRCIPDIIYAEDAEPNRKAGQLKLEEVVLSHNYTKMDRVKTSSLFIHNSRIQFYKKEAEANAELLRNKNLYYWDELTQSFTKMLGKKFERQFDSRTNPAFPYFRQLHIIDIVEINKYSNFISSVGPNRPIIIMEYDEKLSKISLGTNNYIATSIKIDNFNFKKITADYGEEILTIYVFDHQKYDQFNVRLVQYEQNQTYFNSKYQGIVGDFKYYLFITLLLMTTFNLGALWIFKKRLFSRKIEDSTEQVLESERKHFQDSSL